MIKARYKVQVVKKDKDYDLIRYFNDYDKAEAYFKRQHNYDFTMLMDRYNDDIILCVKGEPQSPIQEDIKKALSK